MPQHEHTMLEAPKLRQVAMSATMHCLTGCAIGEVAGMVIGTAFGLHNALTIVISILLAFVFGYSLTLLPLLRQFSLRRALALAFASDTISIAVMEIMDNLVMLLIPGAMDAGLHTLLFWGSLAVSLFLAFIAAFPVNYFLIKKGRGHAVIHEHH